jgi:hypothetical protein
MRKLMVAQFSSTAAWAKLLLYRNNGTPFWALIYTCPLWPAPVVPTASQALKGAGEAKQEQQQQQQQQQQQAGGSRDSGSSGGAGQLQLLVIADVTSQRLKRLGKYVVGKVLGQGASGVVRMGKNPATGERPARSPCCTPYIAPQWGDGGATGVQCMERISTAVRYKPHLV